MEDQTSAYRCEVLAQAARAIGVFAKDGEFRELAVRKKVLPMLLKAFRDAACMQKVSQERTLKEINSVRHKMQQARAQLSMHEVSRSKAAQTSSSVMTAGDGGDSEQQQQQQQQTGGVLKAFSSTAAGVSDSIKKKKGAKKALLSRSMTFRTAIAKEEKEIERLEEMEERLRERNRLVQRSCNHINIGVCIAIGNIFDTGNAEETANSMATNSWDFDNDGPVDEPLRRLQSTSGVNMQTKIVTTYFVPILLGFLTTPDETPRELQICALFAIVSMIQLEQFFRQFIQLGGVELFILTGQIIHNSYGA